MHGVVTDDCFTIQFHKDGEGMSKDEYTL